MNNDQFIYNHIQNKKNNQLKTGTGINASQKLSYTPTQLKMIFSDTTTLLFNTGICLRKSEVQRYKEKFINNNKLTFMKLREFTF